MHKRFANFTTLIFTALVWAAGVTLSPSSLQAQLQPPPGVLFEPDIIYGKGAGQDLKLDLAKPISQPGKSPAIVMIHGGGWVGGDRASMQSMQFNLARAGNVCVTIQYRLAPKAKFPAQLEDVKCAVRWLRAHADQYQIDPDRIASLGISAGAHLAVLLAVTADQTKFEGQGGWAEQSSAVKAAVGIAGPYDLTLGYNNTPKQSVQEGTAVRGMLMSFLGGSPKDVPGQFRDASPISYIRKDTPPLLLCHGVEDTLVPVEQADIMTEKLQAAGASVEYIRIPDGTHSSFGKDQVAHLMQIAEFLKRHLGF